MGIEIKNLQISYKDKVIIPCINLKIPENEITIIIGQNGCGKSTLLKAISRIIPIKEGKIFLDGEDMKNLSPRKISKKIAILPQNPIIPSGINVENLVSYGRFPHQKIISGLNKKDYEVINWAMKEANVYKLKDRIVENLSGGQRQSVWIALTLAQQSDTIILDEPTTYLDMSHQLEILELLKTLNKINKTTIIMVLHDLNHAAKFADNIIGMKDGKIIFEGAPKDTITKENLNSLYGIDAKLIQDEEKMHPICIDYSISKI